MPNIVAVNELWVGNILAESVNSIDGKVLLGKGIILTGKHITLLRSWEIQSVSIDGGEAGTFEKDHSIEYFQFVQAYDLIVNNTVQSFDIIKKKRIIPISNLQDTAADIYSAIIHNNFKIMKYLFIDDNKVIDFISRHSVMVAYFAGIIARQMKWSEQDIVGVTLASLLHDVGNLVVDKVHDSRKQAHIAETAALLKSVKGLSSQVILGIVQHRESMDSSGFPTGVHGSEIHPYARVIAVADIFHNLAYTDDYTNPFPILDMLSREMHVKFDTDVCQNFILRVRDSLLLNRILLSNGQEAEVIFFYPHSYSLPVVKTVDNQIIDLSKEGNLTIKKIVIVK